jgi:hypothetical protein
MVAGEGGAQGIVPYGICHAGCDRIAHFRSRTGRGSLDPVALAYDAVAPSPVFVARAGRGFARVPALPGLHGNHRAGRRPGGTIARLRDVPVAIQAGLDRSPLLFTVEEQIPDIVFPGGARMTGTYCPITVDARPLLSFRPQPVPADRS